MSSAKPLSAQEAANIFNCQVCYDDLSDNNRIMYCLTDYDVKPVFDTICWRPSVYCFHCVKYLISNQFDNYLTNLQKLDCKAELKRLLACGPPTYVRDHIVFSEHPKHEPRWHYCKETDVYEAKVVQSLNKKDLDNIVKNIEQYLDIN